MKYCRVSPINHVFLCIQPQWHTKYNPFYIYNIKAYVSFPALSSLGKVLLNGLDDPVLKYNPGNN
jgi:hypothetical protein